MDRRLDEDLAELFKAQVRPVTDRAAPTGAIMSHGRSLKRRRASMMVVAVVVAVAGAGVAINDALSGADQLAVSDPSVGSTAPEPTPTTQPLGVAELPGAAAPNPALTPESTAAGRTVLTVDDLSVEQRNGLRARPFRDGFLIPTEVFSGGDGRGRSTMSFFFTTDGKQLRRIGSDLTIDSDGGETLVISEPGSESISVVSVSVGSSAKVHLYRSGDVVHWTEEVLAVDFDTDLDLGLAPSLRRVVTPVPLIDQFALDGNRAVLTVRSVLRPSQKMLDKYGLAVGDGLVDERGLIAYPRQNRTEAEPEVIASPDQLGLTAADIELISHTDGADRSWLITVDRTRPATVTEIDGANAHEVFTAFDGSFVHVETPWEGESLPPIDARIEVSDDGVSWRRFEPDIGSGEKVVTELPLGDDLLIVTKTATELKSYRVDRELTMVFLGSWPIPAGYDAYRGVGNLVSIWPADDRPLPLDDADGGGIVFMPVGEYDVTIDLPTDEDPRTRYAIVLRATGDPVVENVVDDPDFLDGSTVDGQQVIRFTDASGRPEIVLSLDELMGGSVPADTPNIEIVTVDGVTWREVPRPRDYSWPVAVNGNKVLVQWDDDNVIEEGEVEFDVYELR